MPRKILIVDDQEDMLLILEREFRRAEGVMLTTTSKFEDALTLVGSNQIDLVVSDVRLGRESGFELVRNINRIYPGVGTILMSAYRSASNRQQAADLGVHAFFEKPFLPRKMLESIDQFFKAKENPAPVEEPARSSSSNDSSALAHFKLQDLVQLFCLNGKNVLITVAPDPQSTAGEIYIQRGRVIHADYAGMTGDNAFYSMMRIGRPLLKVNDWAAPVPVTISTGWEHLLLEAAVRMDEQEAMNRHGRAASGQ